MSDLTLRERAELSDLHYQMRQDMQEDRDRLLVENARLTKQRDIAVEALSNINMRSIIASDALEAEDALAKIKAVDDVQ